MNLRLKALFTIMALLSFMNGVFYLLMPVFSLSILQRPTNPIGIMDTRLFGACAIGLAAIAWSARDFKDPGAQRAMVLGNLITLGLMVCVDLDGLLTGAISVLGWLLFCLDLSLSLGFGYFMLKKSLA
ncbi:MAG: hypothetical protein ABSB41_15965 [Anaerolineales bacterium]|jgi:hypothetical protein